MEEFKYLLISTVDYETYYNIFDYENELINYIKTNLDNDITRIDLCCRIKDYVEFRPIEVVYKYKTVNTLKPIYNIN